MFRVNSWIVQVNSRVSLLHGFQTCEHVEQTVDDVWQIYAGDVELQTEAHSSRWDIVEAGDTSAMIYPSIGVTIRSQVVGCVFDTIASLYKVLTLGLDRFLSTDNQVITKSAPKQVMHPQFAWVHNRWSFDRTKLVVST